jgi:MFS family permease
VRVGLISTAQFVPVILLALVAGASAQRCSLRGLLVAWNALRAGALGFLGDAQAVVGLTFGQLVLAAVIVGIATVFYDVSYQASLPSMIPVESISPANGLLQATYSTTQLAGPAAAGFLLQKLGLPLTVGTAFVLFLGAPVSFMAVPAIQQDRTSGSAPALSIWGGTQIRLAVPAHP